MVAVDLTDPDAPGRRARGGRARATASFTCWSTTPAPAGAGAFAETGWENVERHMKLNFEAPRQADRGAAAAAARDRGEDTRHPVVDRQRRRAPPAASPGPTPAATRPPSSRWPAGATRSPPRSAPHGVHVGLVLPGLRRHRGLPAGRAGRPPAAPPDRLPARGGRRGDRRVRTAGQGRALRAAALLARGGAADPGAGPGPSGDRGRDLHARDRLGSARLRLSYTCCS